MADNTNTRITLDWQEIGQDMLSSGFWLVAIALTAIYTATTVLMIEGPWQTDQDSHGPFILLIVALIILLKAHKLRKIKAPKTSYLGWLSLLGGLFFYVIGHSQSLMLLDAGSIIPVLGGLILITKGKEGLKELIFPLCFLIFAVPMPGWLMDSLTQPMKLALSDQVVNLLYYYGYPVGQNGVILYIEQYQLLVKDACVGLNSLHSLAAVGIIYIYLSKPSHLLHTLFLLLIIVPAAYAANLVRVIALVLITYYFGEAAGQGFLHDFAGLVMFVTALLLFIAIDSVIFFGIVRYKKRKAAIS
ncbi:exosortase [Kordiimonas sp. SCSIO 12610]|uniref:exosortase n=1 Tax=Kordiimonas sp. SCSIO 12610 TaxID=2829597 RepID=UPI00210E5379|nr:exosortase [Kordiimonas sp. SCSIO 12610]UTW55860.1 exosortase [Kordiimonas sp. SCSIO 12610]